MPESFPATDLQSFPRPSVAVDVAVFTVVDGALCVLLWRRSGNTARGEWALPGSFVREGERLADAVARTLRDKCRVTGLAPQQLRVMDAPDRDDRGWVLSVAHLDAVRATSLPDRDAAEVRLAQVRAVPSTGAGESVLDLPDGQRHLPFDHEAIVRLALAELRAQYAERPDPAGLLGDPFTVLELRRLHEAVAGTRLQKDTFRRTMTPRLVELADTQDGTVGRPAKLFERRRHPRPDIDDR